MKNGNANPGIRDGSATRADGDIGLEVSRTRGLKRVLVLPAAVVIQTCLGGVYAWSALAAALRADFALTAAQTQFVFGMTIAAMTLSMIVGGRGIARVGARGLTLCGGALFGIGHWVSARSGGAFSLIMAGSGVLVGLGTGLGYTSALTTVGQWYPRRRGLAIGVAVAGFGAGAILLTALISRLLEGGLPVLDILRRVGLAYAAVIVLAGILLFRPHPLEEGPAEGRTGTPPRLGRDDAALFVGIFSGTFAGLLVIGDLASLGADGGLSLRVASVAIAGFALGNSSGRIAWGWLADRFGYRTIPLSLVFLSFSLMILYAVRSQSALFLAAAWLTGFGFGANFVLYAVQTALRHGSRGLALLYPKIFLAYGVAGMIGPAMGGYLRDMTGAYGAGIGMAVALLLIAAGVTAAIGPIQRA